MSIAAYWMFGSHGAVEVDDTGNIQVAVRAQSDSPAGSGSIVERRAGRDGFARADVSDVGSLQDMLDKARMFARAVFPAAEPGRPDLEFTWQERADAFRLLDFHRKIPAHHKPDSNARVVSEFLRDWKREQTQLGRAGIPEELDEFAESWERWW